MSQHISSVSSRVLLSFCHDIVPIVATFLPLFALSYVATILSLSRQSALPIMEKSAAFLAFFFFFCSKHPQNINLGEDSIISY